jgi:drug/metabolite transporter (DMT)-like permease
MCFVISLCVVGVWAFLAREWKIARRDVKEMALLGLIGYTYSIGMQFVGTDLSGAASGALITSAFPAFISVFTWSTLREKTNLRQGTALAITIRRYLHCNWTSVRKFHFFRGSSVFI